MSPKKQTAYINQMKRTSADNGVNLVIFDADDDFSKKKDELVKWKEQNNVDFQLFLFPDNSSSDELEDLLELVINPENQPVMDCWKTYEDSLKEIDLPWRKGAASYHTCKENKDIRLFGSTIGNFRIRKEENKGA